MKNTQTNLFKIIDCKKVAHNTFLLKFNAPQIAKIAQPGQFVNILVSEESYNPLLRRPFSIAGIENDNVEILFHAIGLGTKILSQKSNGDLINIIGPLGNGFNYNKNYETAIIVAGGIGIAPFPFLTSELIKLNKKIETFVGFRSYNFIYKDNLKNVHISTDDGSDGFKGNVVQLLEDYLSKNNLEKIKIFACGPNVMLKALAQFAKTKNICCELSLEGQMACGIGICQGCPVERSSGDQKYALVCKNGPTFDSNDIQF